MLERKGVMCLILRKAATPRSYFVMEETTDPAVHMDHRILGVFADNL